MLHNLLFILFSLYAGHSFGAAVAFKGALTSTTPAPTIAPAPEGESDVERVIRLMPALQKIRGDNHAFPHFSRLKPDDKKLLCELFGVSEDEWKSEQPKRFKTISRKIHPDRCKDYPGLISQFNGLCSEFADEKNKYEAERRAELIRICLAKSAAVITGTVAVTALFTKWITQRTKRILMQTFNIFGSCAPAEEELILHELNKKSWSVPALVRRLIRTPAEQRARFMMYEKIGTLTESLFITCTQYYSPTLCPKLLSIINAHVVQQIPRNSADQSVDFQALTSRLHLLTECIDASLQKLTRDQHFAKTYREHMAAVKRLPRKTPGEQMFWQQTLSQLEDHIVGEIQKVLRITHVIVPVQTEVPTEPATTN
jgi:hypothetical protein